MAQARQARKPAPVSEPEKFRYKVVAGKHALPKQGDGPRQFVKQGEEIMLTPEEAARWPGKFEFVQPTPPAPTSESSQDPDGGSDPANDEDAAKAGSDTEE